MNVNAAIKSMSVLSFQSAQPNDPRNDWIAARRVWRENFAGEPPIVEHGADWCVVTDFLCNHEITKRSCHSPQKITQPEFGRGNRVGCHHRTVLQKHYLLIANAYYQLMGRVDLGGEERGSDRN